MSKSLGDRWQSSLRVIGHQVTLEEFEDVVLNHLLHWEQEKEGHEWNWGCRGTRPTCILPSWVELGGPALRTVPSPLRPLCIGTWMEDSFHTWVNPHSSQDTAEKTEAPIPGTSISPKFIKMCFGKHFQVIGEL